MRESRVRWRKPPRQFNTETLAIKDRAATGIRMSGRKVTAMRRAGVQPLINANGHVLPSDRVTNRAPSQLSVSTNKDSVSAIRIATFPGTGDSAFVRQGNLRVCSSAQPETDQIRTLWCANAYTRQYTRGSRRRNSAPLVFIHLGGADEGLDKTNKDPGTRARPMNREFAKELLVQLT
jgi:hypothetical protein